MRELQVISILMRKFLLSLLTAISGLAASAAGYNVVVVTLASGEELDIVMRDDLAVRFTDSHLVASSGEATVEIPKADIACFQHVYKPQSSVDEFCRPEDEMIMDGDMLLFSNMPEGSRVVVCDFSGKTVMAREVSGEASVFLGELLPGSYIVNVNNKSYKISLR